MTHPLDIPLNKWKVPLMSSPPCSGVAKKSRKRTFDQTQLDPLPFTAKRRSTSVRFSENVDEIVSSQEFEPERDISHLLGLDEWVAYDPNTPGYVATLNADGDTALYAYMELSHHRIQALRTRVRALEIKLASFTVVEQKLRYVYAWIKGAAAKGVFKLPIQ